VRACGALRHRARAHALPAQPPLSPGCLNAPHGPRAEFKKRLAPHVSSTLAPPNFLSEFIKDPKKAKEDAAAPAATPSKVTLNFFLPYEQQMKAKEVRCLLAAPLECAVRPAPP